jgi:hypothetical protein
LPPFVPALKGIKFLFATCKKGLDTACKIQKSAKNQRVLQAVVEYLPAACKRVSDCLRAVAKGNQIPFRADCMRNLRIACNADNVSNIPLRGLTLKIKKYRQVLKLCLPSAVFIPMRAYRTMLISGRSNLVRRYL